MVVIRGECLTKGPLKIQVWTRSIMDQKQFPNFPFFFFHSHVLVLNTHKMTRASEV